jgi:hypothetical protein
MKNAGRAGPRKKRSFAETVICSKRSAGPVIKSSWLMFRRLMQHTATISKSLVCAKMNRAGMVPAMVAAALKK